MPTLISPSVNPSGQPVSQAGTRGRGAEQPEGRSFGAVLDRSRAASGAKTSASSDAAPETAAARRPIRDGELKSELSAADVLALLAPLAAPIAAPIVATPANGRRGADAAAPTAKGAAIAGVLPDGVSADASASATALPEGDAAVVAASQAAGAEETSMAVAQDAPAADGAPDTPHAAKQPASAIDPSARTALAQPVAAPQAATAPASSSGMPPIPGARATAPSAGEAGAASAAAPTDTPRTAAIQAAAGAATSIAAGTAPKGAEPLDTDTASSPQALQPLASAMPAAADRAAATRSATPVLSVAPPVGSHEWGPAIGQQMIRMSASGHQVAELNLNPAGLGPLKVTLTMGDNQAQAMFVSAHEGVRRAVEAALPQLRTTLAEQGISLGHTSVGAETRQPSQQGSFAEQNPGRSSGQPDYPGAGRGTDNAAAPQRAASRPDAVRAASAGLDTFA